MNIKLREMAKYFSRTAICSKRFKSSRQTLSTNERSMLVSFML